MSIVAPLIFVFILGFVIALLLNPYFRKLFSKKVDWEMEKAELEKEIERLKGQLAEHEKQAGSRKKAS